ncbi:MAG: TIM barrel protein [Actinomycetota bacterium]
MIGQTNADPGRPAGWLSNLLSRVAGAPITWGVDGSPGWGHLMHPDRVLTEMVETGLHATELGPDGYLPRDPGRLRDYLSRFEMQIVGGFVPALLYRPDRLEAELDYVRRASKQLAATGARTLVLGPSTDHSGYDSSSELTEDEWIRFGEGLKRLDQISQDHGLATAVHPHWGMAIERPAQIDRFLESTSVGLCLDTGHVFLGGGDPVHVARHASGRVIHVHLKDVDAAWAERVRSGHTPFRQAVIEGMFVPLGKGAVDIHGVIGVLEQAGYGGWYVLEQDVSLRVEPDPGLGPRADAEASIEFLSRLSPTWLPSERPK